MTSQFSSLPDPLSSLPDPLSSLPDPRSQGFGHVQKVPTGIEGFDDICHGGLPTGRATLISGTSGTGKTVFSLHFLYNGIKQFGEPGIFVTFEESPIDILRNASSFGWALQDLVQHCSCATSRGATPSRSPS